MPWSSSHSLANCWRSLSADMRWRNYNSKVPKPCKNPMCYEAPWSTILPKTINMYILVTHACQHANTWRQNGQTMTNQTSVLINQPTNTNNLVTIDIYRYYSASELLFLFFWAATFQNNLLVWGDRHDVADELAGASVSSPPTACAIDCIWVNMGQLPSKST
jgi:hypothetical protein